MDKQKLIEKLLDEKAEKDNRIDLNAYALGLDAMFDAIQHQELLQECKLQLEYLNEKFGETGTTNALLSKINRKIS